MGKDTHAVSAPAQRTALEVLAANGVDTIIQENDGVTPTPVISRAILVYNRGRKDHFADGIVITPSHNPPEDGGFKYNPPNGGPADTDVTGWVAESCERIAAREKCRSQSACHFEKAIRAATTHQEDFVLALCSRSQERRRHRRHSRRPSQAGRGPSGRGIAAVLGTDQLDLWTGRSRRQPESSTRLFRS